MFGIYYLDGRVGMFQRFTFSLPSHNSYSPTGQGTNVGFLPAIKCVYSNSIFEIKEMSQGESMGLIPSL